VSQESLFGEVLDAAPTTGDDLDRMLTPQPLAELCVKRVLQRCPVSACRVVLEPSVGGGAFVRAVHKYIPRAEIWGVDLDPMANGLNIVDRAFVGIDTVDWSKLDHWREHGTPQLIVGNLPFGPALEHVRALLELRPFRLASILPWDRIEQAQWHDLLWEEPVPGMTWREVHPIRPRPWGKHVRATCLMVWGHAEPRCQRVIGDPIIWK
jgi:hypothetical protein